jgi:hypothetical protein
MRRISFSMLFTMTAAAFADAAPAENFVGSFEGESLGAHSSGQSFVICLRVTEQAGTYSLFALMNDTNWESGMDHTSNTHWRWTGSGSIQRGILIFIFSSPHTPPEKGSLQRTRRGLLLKLGTVQYRIQRVSEPCQSANPPNQAMQRTASKAATDVLRVCLPRVGCVARFTRLAVADLVSR